MTNTLQFILEHYHLDVWTIPKKVELPSANRTDLAILFRELGFKIGAEIGVGTGTYSETLCKANPDLLLYSIDPWTYKAYKDSRYGMPYLEHEFEDNFNAATERLSKYNCRIIRDYSLSAVDRFDDGYFDFVYIDGNHDFQNATNDIVEWSKKVRAGGIVAGHDYTRYAPHREIHVKQVVDAYTYALGISPWFVIDNKNKSWFWVKESYGNQNG